MRLYGVSACLEQPRGSNGTGARGAPPAQQHGGSSNRGDEDGRGWKRMEEDGRRWKRVEEDGERRKVVVHASVLGWAAHLSPLTCLHVERGREATESDGTWA